MFKQLLDSKNDATEETTPLDEKPNHEDGRDSQDDSMQAPETLGKVVRLRLSRF